MQIDVRRKHQAYAMACQLAYRLCSMQCDDAEFVVMRNSILSFANQFHRVGERGVLEEK